MPSLLASTKATTRLTARRNADNWELMRPLTNENNVRLPPIPDIRGESARLRCQRPLRVESGHSSPCVEHPLLAEIGQSASGFGIEIPAARLPSAGITRFEPFRTMKTSRLLVLGTFQASAIIAMGDLEPGNSNREFGGLASGRIDRKPLRPLCERTAA